MAFLPKKPQRGQNSLQSIYDSVCQICDYLPATQITVDNKYLLCEHSKNGTIIKGNFLPTGSGGAKTADDPYNGLFVKIKPDLNVQRTNADGFNIYKFITPTSAEFIESTYVHFINFPSSFVYKSTKGIYTNLIRGGDDKLYTNADPFDGQIEMILNGGNNRSGFLFKSKYVSDEEYDHTTSSCVVFFDSMNDYFNLPHNVITDIHRKTTVTSSAVYFTNYDLYDGKPVTLKPKSGQTPYSGFSFEYCGQEVSGYTIKFLNARKSDSFMPEAIRNIQVIAHRLPLSGDNYYPNKNIGYYSDELLWT